MAGHVNQYKGANAEQTVTALRVEDVRAGVLRGRQMLPREVCKILMYKDVWTYNPSGLHAWSEYSKILDMCAVCFGESAGYTEAENENSNGTFDLGPWQLNSIHKPPSWSMEKWRAYCIDPYQCIFSVRQLYYPARENIGSVWFAYAVVNKPENFHRFYGPAAAGIVNAWTERQDFFPIPHYKYG